MSKITNGGLKERSREMGWIAKGEGGERRELEGREGKGSFGSPPNLHHTPLYTV